MARSFRLVVVFVAALVLIVPATAASGSATVTNVRLTIPFAVGGFIPCAAGGAGEFVSGDGELDIVFHSGNDATGGFHLFNLALIGGKATGADTGETYVVKSIAAGHTVALESTFTSGFVSTFRITGGGSTFTQAFRFVFVDNDGNGQPDGVQVQFEKCL